MSIATGPVPALKVRGAAQSTTDSQDMSIYSLLKARADQTPDAIAIAAPGRAPLTYGRNYVPQHYPGQAIYIKSAKRSGDHRLKWGKVMAGGLEVHEIPGDHLDLINEPYFRLWAEKLRDALRRNGPHDHRK